MERTDREIAEETVDRDRLLRRHRQQRARHRRPRRRRIDRMILLDEKVHEETLITVTQDENTTTNDDSDGTHIPDDPDHDPNDGQLLLSFAPFPDDRSDQFHSHRTERKRSSSATSVGEECGVRSSERKSVDSLKCAQISRCTEQRHHVNFSVSIILRSLRLSTSLSSQMSCPLNPSLANRSRMSAMSLGNRETQILIHRQRSHSKIEVRNTD